MMFNSMETADMDLKSAEIPEVIHPIQSVLDKKYRTGFENSDGEINSILIVKGMSPEVYKSLATSPLADYALNNTETSQLPSPGKPEATYACAVRLKKICQLIEEESINKTSLIHNMVYTVKVLETIYAEETGRLKNEDFEISDVAPDSVPDEIRQWLATTFTRNVYLGENESEKPRFRSVANAIRAGIVVERIYRRMSSCGNLVIPPNVLIIMKTGMDSWDFNIFEMNDYSDNHALKFIGYELFHKYDFIKKFNMDRNILENLLIQLEIGYSKNKNPYHNLVHAADVTQTCHVIMNNSKINDWLTDLEIFSTLFAALIHDYDHTGTTNNFHIQTKSRLAMLYNDRCVLENHHVSSVFSLTTDESFDIFKKFTPDQYKEFRSAVIEIVINTDMSLHFLQIKTMKNLLSLPESIDKLKALSLLVHCADISHPSKQWEIHQRWTDVLCEEFFLQGDREKEMGLPISPLCDRTAVVVPQSQLGFIDFIVIPSFNILGDMLECLLKPNDVRDQDHEAEEDDDNTSLSKWSEDSRSICRPWEINFENNKKNWSAQLSDVHNEN